MAVEASGTQAATIGTEHTLSGSFTTEKTYLLYVDTTNLLNGDELELRVKMKAASGGSELLIWAGYYIHSQTDVLKASVPIRSPYSCSFTLKQTVGTGRSFPWVILSV